MPERVYIAIDLKSFYASAECVERGLDPLRTHLVVADASRTEKTICLAVSPSLKAYGIPGRTRLFEVVRKVREQNALRLTRARCESFAGESCDAVELARNPKLAISYITAPPRMARYIACSSRIYSIYLKYIAPEDIHVYSIDEVFIDATAYLSLYGLTARELAMKLILEVLRETGITAAAGIGTNLYLAKIAMDIQAKHIPADENGVRIAELDETAYRKFLWDHRPITDFWRVGRGTAQKLAKVGLFTMGEIARCSLGSPEDFHNEDLLYRLFGINAELLIDHAWGWEPCTMADIKAYRPAASSISSGQVLPCPYDAAKAHLVACEMAEQLAMDLFEKHLTTDQLVLTVGYEKSAAKHAQGTADLPRQTAAVSVMVDTLSKLYRRIVRPDLAIRRLTLCAGHVLPERAESCVSPDAPKTFGSFESSSTEAGQEQQLDLFDLCSGSTDLFGRDRTELRKQEEAAAAALENERKIQQSLLEIKHRFGKNAVIRGRDLEEGATAMQRNDQIGGHKA